MIATTSFRLGCTAATWLLKPLPVICCIGLAFAIKASAAVLYVDVSSTSPIPPYTNWMTAATIIQDAIDAAISGDKVLVTNGIYQTGGAVIGSSSSNRIALNKALCVQSVHGPQVTTILGYQVPDTVVGDQAVRCAYLGNGAILSGFTLSNGATPSEASSPEQAAGAGVFCEASSDAVVSNCIISGNTAIFGAGVWGGKIKDSMVISNSAINGPGGGALNSYLTNSTVSFNSSVTDGGGAHGSILTDCNISANTASYNGGGAEECSLTNSVLTGNAASVGGGADASTLTRCKLFTNSALQIGGGASSCSLLSSVLIGNMTPQQGGGAGVSNLKHCLLVGNSAAYYGGGAVSCDLLNCTLVDNLASKGGGGLSEGAATNCIFYHNTAPISPDATGDTIAYSCINPIPGVGEGNITNAPLFINQSGGNFRPQTNSPCIDAGQNIQGLAIDLDGRPRIVNGIVDMGAYEFQSTGNGEFTAWLEQYRLPTDGSADNTDPDQDGLNNWQEWRCGTVPTNYFSALRLLAPSVNASVAIRWESVTNRTYTLERSTNFPTFPSFQPVAMGIVGLEGVTTYNDSSITNQGPVFYRIKVD